VLSVLCGFLLSRGSLIGYNFVEGGEMGSEDISCVKCISAMIRIQFLLPIFVKEGTQGRRVA
jgi:hypothetical protein